MARAGFGREPEQQKTFVMLMRIEGKMEAHYDDLDWPNQRTWGEAHRYIIKHFDSLESGAVVDVEWILGESRTVKQSEAVTAVYG